MLPQEMRLPVHRRIHGKAIRTPEFKLFYQKSTSKSSRLKIIVSKKVSPKAVVRNKLKRQICALFMQNNFPIPLDMLLVLEPKATQHDACTGLKEAFNSLATNLV